MVGKAELLLNSLFVFLQVGPFSAALSMNNSDATTTMTSPSYDTTVTQASDTRLLTSVPAHAETTMIPGTTTAPSSDSAIVGVVITVIVLTLFALAFLLYRYLCHNKGAYRTTGELAPGEDPDEEHANQDTDGKKEYFI